MRTGKAEVIVKQENTAAALGSGLLPVFATPALVALMEYAACKALEGMLDEGITTVGTQIDVEHLSATPVGMRAVAEATLVEENGRNYSFTVEAYDEAGLIGRATHKRVAVKTERFLQKTLEKQNNLG